MPDPKVQIIITADGNQAGREVAKAGSELMKLGVGSVTVGNLLADLGQRALQVGKDLARFPVDAAVAVGRYAEQLENLTAETGLSADEQQAYNVVLTRTGLGLQDLSGIWRILSQNIIAARDPASDAAQKFRQLGIELNGSEGPNEVLRLVSERLQALPNAFQRNAMATELLGRSGARFLPAFKDGLAGAATEAQRLGTMLNDNARVKAVAFDNATDDLSLAWQGFTHQIGVLAAPALTTAVTGMTAATAEAAKLAAEMNNAKTVGEGLAAVLARVSPFTASGLAQLPASGPKDLPVGVPPESVLDALEASGPGFITPGDEQAEKARHIIQRSLQTQFATAHMTELNPDLASTFDITQVMAREKSDAASRARPDLSGMNALQRGVAALRELMPELDANEALQQVEHNLASAQATVLASVDGWQSYRDGLNDAAEGARVLESAQAELFQTESGFIGAADAARRVSFARIDAEEAQKRQLILDTYGESARAQQKLVDLEAQSMTQRRAVIRQYPTFWEQQLQAVVNANSFSLGSIVSTWSSGLAQAAVQHTNFNETVQAAWKSTQIAVLQAGLNTLVQWGIQSALAAAREIALALATEAGKTAAVTAGAASRTGVAVAEAATTGEVYEGMATATFGSIASVQAATVAFMTSAWAVLLKIGNFIVGLLSAVAVAMKSTIFGIPVGLLIAGAAIGLAAYLASQGQLMAAIGVGLAGVAAGAAGLGAFGGGGGGVTGLDVSTVGFAAEGGIFDRPFVIAEVGVPEVAIPLDGRGKRFMNQLGFGGGAGEQRIIVQVGDDVLLEKMLRGMPKKVHLKLGAAFS